MNESAEIQATRRRPARRIDRKELRLHGVLVGCALLVQAALSLSGAGLPPAFHKPTLADFAQFHAGARMIANGDVGRLYIPTVFFDAVAATVPWKDETLYPPVYPAHVYAAFVPLAHMPFGYAALVFSVLSVAAYVLALRVLAAPFSVPRPLAWLAVGNPALVHVLMSGQLSAFAMLSLAGAWGAWRTDRLFLVGLWLGSLAWKPQLLLVALVAWLARPTVAIAAGVATAAGIHAMLFTIVAGPAAWPAYTHVLTLVSTSPAIFSKVHQLQSLKGAVALLLPRGVLFTGVLVTCVVAVLLATVYVARRTDDQRHAFAAVALCGLLISPHVYVYDALIVSVSLFLIAEAALERGTHRRSDVAAYALHWSPLLIAFVEVTRVQLGVLFALLWLGWSVRERLSQLPKASPQPFDGPNGIRRASPDPPQ